MKYFFILLFAFSATVFACKAKKSSETNAPKEPTTNKTIGKVSHQYKGTGCNTVIIITSNKGEEPITLIPVPGLDEKLDIDGLEIQFNYKSSRVKQPEGCSVGIPAIISDAAKLK